MEGRQSKSRTRQPRLPPFDRAAEAEDEELIHILVELNRGEWRLQAWARELGVSDDEMLIELDRHVHHRIAA